MEIEIIIEGGPVLSAELNHSSTAEKIYKALPIRGEGNTWGEEIYFSIPVQAALEHPREVLEAGELAYWPDMQAFCIFYGPTPASRGEEIRAAGPVDVVGRIQGDISPLKNVRAPLKITLEKK